MLAKQRQSLSPESPASPSKLVSFLGYVRENVPSAAQPSLPLAANSSVDWSITFVFTFSLSTL